MNNSDPVQMEGVYDFYANWVRGIDNASSNNCSIQSVGLWS